MRLFLFSLCVSLSSFLSLPAQAVSQDIGVMFWNVENLFDTKKDPNRDDKEFTPEGAANWTESKLAQKMKNLAKVITAETGLNGQACPDFLGLVEVENLNVVRQFKNEHLAECRYNKIVLDRLDPDPRGIRAASLTRLDLGGSPRSHSAYEGARFIQEVPIRVGDNTVTFFVNHWKSRRQTESDRSGGVSQRMKSATTLRKRAEQLLEKNEAADLVFMGDFNDEPENQSLRDTLRSTMKFSDFADQLFLFWNPSAEILRLPAFEDGVQDPETRSLYRKARGTYYFHGEKRFNQLDNFMLSWGMFDDSGLRYKPMSYKVVKHPDFKDREERPLGFNRHTEWRGASDHFPIYMQLTVAE
jgi:hypothetical protein